MNRNIPKKDKEKALLLYKNGMTLREVAKIINISPNTIHYWAKNSDSLRSHYHRVSKCKDRALVLYKKGYSSKKIEKILNGPKARTIRLWVNKAGLTRGPCNWKGGIEPLNHKIRTSKDIEDWRLAVFERDGFRCQCCGEVGVYLNAHHILAFSKYPEQRFNINNGVTLCKNCHIDLHHKKQLNYCA